FQAEDGMRYFHVTGVQTCALPIFHQKAHRFNTDIQRFSNSGAPQTAFRTYELSDKAYVDASYIRMKNVSLVYLLPEHWLGRLALNECRISLHCQNLLTITGYQGSDPEVPNPRQLPPLRMITGKIQLTF